MRSVLSVHWRDWCWSWSSNSLATWCEELTHWKRPWCWENWGQEEKGITEDGMAGWHHWLNGHEFGWWTGRPGMLWFMGLQRVGHNWVTKLNWTKWMSLSLFCLLYCFSSSHLPFLTSLFLFIFTGCQISIESIIFQITICKNCL